MADTKSWIFEITKFIHFSPTDQEKSRRHKIHLSKIRKVKTDSGDSKDN